MAFPQPSGRKQVARKVTPSEPDGAEPGFQSVTDYQTSSQGQAFKSSSRLTNQPAGSSGGRYNMEAVYRRSSPKDGQRSTKQMSDDIADLHEASIGIHKHLTESWDREAAMAEMMAQISDKMNFLHSKALKGGDLSTQNSDLHTQNSMAPLLEELRSSEQRNGELLTHLTAQVEHRLAQQIVQVREEVQDVNRRQKVAEDVHFVQVMEEIRKSEVQMQKSISMMAMQAVSHSNDEHSLKADEQDETARIVEFLEKQDARQTRLRNDHFERVMVQFRATQNTNGADMRTVLSELGKVQQALHTDFAQIVDDKDAKECQKLEDGDVVHTEVERLGDTDAEEGVDGQPHAIELSKRYRHFWTQSDTSEKTDMHCQTDDSLLVDAGYVQNIPKKKKKKAKELERAPTAVHAVVLKKAVFADAEDIKRKMRQQILDQQHHVTDSYHDSGMFQYIASSRCFENFTLLVIFLNAVWIAIDTDMNEADVLYNAHPVFIVAENVFCTYFTWELFTRFMAFRHKRDCLREVWFVFDFVLVLLMIIETWIINGLIMIILGGESSAGAGNASVLRLIRLVRMLRISRMARLLRSIPELVVLIKGIKAAFRSVMVFFLLWFIIIYVFAIMFKQLTLDETIGEQYFDTVPSAMNTLLLHGLLPDHSGLVNDVAGANPYLFPIIMLFIMLAAVTVMYMLVGVLVDVIQVIANTEKELMTVSSLANELRNMFDIAGRNIHEPITHFEFRNLLQDPHFCSILTSVNVDVMMLFDMLDIIYEDRETEASGLPFDKFLELILGMRGGNQATVKDIKECLKVTRKMMSYEFEQQFCRLQAEFCAVQRGIQQLEEDILEEHDADEMRNQVTDRNSGARHSIMDVMNSSAEDGDDGDEAFKPVSST